MFTRFGTAYFATSAVRWESYFPKLVAARALHILALLGPTLVFRILERPWFFYYASIRLSNVKNGLVWPLEFLVWPDFAQPNFHKSLDAVLDFNSVSSVYPSLPCQWHSGLQSNVWIPWQAIVRVASVCSSLFMHLITELRAALELLTLLYLWLLL